MKRSMAISSALGQDAGKKSPSSSVCDVPVDQPACSYTGINGSCTITVNRLSPATPPTIYAKLRADSKSVSH